MGDPPTPFNIALRVLAAAVGIGAVMSFVGGAVLWIRFDELRLPADQVVTLLPKHLLLIVGAHAMAVPVGVGVFAAVVFVLANALDPKGEHTGRRELLVWLFALGTAVRPERRSAPPVALLTSVSSLPGSGSREREQRGSTPRPPA